MDNFNKAIQWFIDHNNTSNNKHTSKIPDTNINLVSPMEGIYKPKGSKYAVSVKQTLRATYKEQKPYKLNNGASIYLYHQRSSSESSDWSSLNDDLKNFSSNRALEKNWKDEKFVGVIIQTKDRKGRRPAEYDIKVGRIIGWYYGYFVIYCLPGKRKAIFDKQSYEKFISEHSIGKIVSDSFSNIGDKTDIDATISFDPTSISDERQKVMRSIALRRGQPDFRKKLIEAYSGTCPITGYDVLEVLEAAHITPYKGDKTNILANGLLLRSDIHLLWDKYLLDIIKINGSYFSLVSDSIKQSKYYDKFNKKEIIIPDNIISTDFDNALKEHNKFFK